MKEVYVLLNSMLCFLMHPKLVQWHVGGPKGQAGIPTNAKQYLYGYAVPAIWNELYVPPLLLSIYFHIQHRSQNSFTPSLVLFPTPNFYSQSVLSAFPPFHGLPLQSSCEPDAIVGREGTKRFLNPHTTSETLYR